MLLVVMVADAYQYRIAYFDMGGGGQKSTTFCSAVGKKDTNFPLSFPCYCHLLLVSVLSHSPFRHPSICPISPAMARFDLDRGGGGCCGKGSWNSVSLARRIHYAPWRGKHRSFPVGIGLHRPNPKLCLCSLYSADNLPYFFSISIQVFDCKSVPLRQALTNDNM